ncbi:F-box/kelch-repeat protein At3g23880-like [Euphorbia lathyris]|uniref:F-box/kelch-repeat protein At3g23880-like n=1 Tax=Euphorbia lathyris TaxID=212925 RepID=UPI0033136A5B
MWDCLPDEVLTEKILSRLPVKSIIQCRCVCKSWFSLITTPIFISNYLRNLNLNLKTQNTQLFLHQRDYYDKTSGSCALLFDNNEQDYLRPMLLRLLPDGCIWQHMVGSVNGLICLSGVNPVLDFILFNPSIGRFLSVPHPPFTTTIYTLSTVMGLGFDESTQDYKILFIVGSRCFIYSLNSNSWRRLITPPLLNSSSSSYRTQSAVFVNGRFHWLAVHHLGQWNFHCDFIMVFDVKTETFHQISLPECLAYFQPHQPGLINARRIMEFGDSSIAAIEPAEYAAHVWVMKEYGLVESWIKLATLKLEFYYSPVLGFRNKDEVLILLNPISGAGPVRESECIISRNINNEEIKNLMNVEEHSACIFSRVYKYVPSLVLLDKQNNFDAPVVDVDVDVDVTPLVEDEEELRRSKCALAYGLCSEIGQLCH